MASPPRTPQTTSTPPPVGQPTPPTPKGVFQVELPGGGRLELENQDEVDMWNDAKRKYEIDYGFTRTNDLILLGAMLSQGIAMYRAQVDLTSTIKGKAATASTRIASAAAEIRALEKALGIDKKTRDSSSGQNLAEYLAMLKRAAHARGVHISERTRAYEAFNMTLRMKIRVLRNADDEDRAYEGVSETSIIQWAEDELARLESKDQAWSQEKGKVFVGRL